MATRGTRVMGTSHGWFDIRQKYRETPVLRFGPLNRKSHIIEPEVAPINWPQVPDPGPVADTSAWRM